MIRTKNISFTYKETDNPGDLDIEGRELLESALNVASNAYAPYSGFKVGAAVRLASGKIILGTNVENAAFPSGICAERSALSNASSNYPGDKPVAIAVAALSNAELTDDPVPPCGNCRQVIAEEESRNGNEIRIILSSKNKIQIIEKCADLLPMQFNKNNLKVNPH
ncbi:MAG: cytidine deaminase [Bacteroidales bacterium]|jgi:cytidine deaminase|nr:cytidine deaminase [Bacteroidales bacterium]